MRNGQMRSNTECVSLQINKSKQVFCIFHVKGALYRFQKCGRVFLRQSNVVALVFIVSFCHKSLIACTMTTPTCKFTESVNNCKIDRDSI